jgi:hypothetical protein
VTAVGQVHLGAAPGDRGSVHAASLRPAKCGQ